MFRVVRKENPNIQSRIGVKTILTGLNSSTVLIDASCRVNCRALMTVTFQLESWTDLHGFST